MNLFLTMFFLVVCIFYIIKEHQFEKNIDGETRSCLQSHKKYGEKRE